MSDSQTLLLVLVVLYLGECLLWVRRGGVVFRTWLGRRWTLNVHSGVVANDRGDLHWQWPLPPMGTVNVVRAPSLAITPTGVLGGTSEVLPGQCRPRATGRFIPWESLKSAVADQKRLLVNGELLWQSDSPHEPLRLAALLTHLAALAPAKCLAAVERELAAAFDRAALEAARGQFRKQATPVRRLANTLFGFLLVLAPTAIWRFGWLPTLWFLLPVLVALIALTTRSFLQAHRALYPDAGDERFRLGILIALAPITTVRATDALARSALERFHPLTAAVTLLPRAEATAFARRVWRDLKFPWAPEFPSNDPAAVAAARWFRERELVAVEALLAAEKIDLAALAKQAPPSEPENTQHCERCETQFTAVATRCAECGGRPLIPLV